MEVNTIKANLEKKGLWEKIKQVFNETQAAPIAPIVPTETPVTLAQVKTKDGAMISYEGEKLDVGVAVKMVGADGISSDITDGEYELEDGSKVTVKGGLVESIVPAVVVEVEPLATPEMMTKLTEVQTQLEAQTKKYDALSLKFEAMEKTLATNTSHVKTSLEAINAICETPADEPIVPTKKFEEMTKAEQVKFNRGK